MRRPNVSHVVGALRLRRLHAWGLHAAQLVALLLLVMVATTAISETMGDVTCLVDDGHVLFDGTFGLRSGSLTSASLLGISGGAASITGWVRLTAGSSSTDQTIVAFGAPADAASAAGYLTLSANQASGQLRLLFGAESGGSGLSATASTTLISGNWFHVAVTFTAAGVRSLFINSVRVATGTASSPFTSPTTGSQLVLLGARFSSDGSTLQQFIKGALDDVRFFARVITTDELGCLFTTMSVDPTSTLLAARWTFSEQDNLLANDATSGGTTLTASGSGIKWESVPATNPPHCIQATSLCTLRASSALQYALNIGSSPADATLSPSPTGSAAAPAVVNLSPLYYLDLQNPADNNYDATASGLFPSGGLIGIGATGFTIFTWIKLPPSLSSTSIGFFSASASSSSTSYQVQFTQYSTTQRVQFNVYSATGVQLCAWVSSSVQLMASPWQGIGMSWVPAPTGSSVIFFAGGVSETISTTCTQLNANTGLLNMTRNSARMGQSASSTDGRFPTGSQTAGLWTFSRTLTFDEMGALSMSPPSSIFPLPQNAVNAPAFLALGETSQSIGVTPQLVVGAPVAFAISSVGGSVSSTGQSYTPITTHFTVPTTTLPTWSITYPALQTAGFITMTITYTSYAQLFYQQPATITIPVATVSTSLASASFSLLTSSSSLNAGFQSASSPATGNYVTFDGSSSFIDLTNSQDTHNGVMPTFGRTGFAVAFWLMGTGTTNVIEDILSCGVTSTTDWLFLQLSATNAVSYRWTSLTLATTPATMQVANNVWQQVTLSVDYFGAVWVQIGGVTGAAQTVTVMPNTVDRPYCVLGKNIAGSVTFTGQIASMYFFNRYLTQGEARTMAATPPSNIAGGFNVINVPGLAQAAAYTSIVLQATVLTSQPVVLQLATNSGGFTTPGTFSFSGTTSSITFTLTLPTLPDGVTQWNLTSTMSGAAAIFYTKPSDQVILLVTPARTLSSAIFSLDTSIASSNAGWTKGYVANTGYATFDGTGYLDLTQSADTRGAVMPMFGGTALQPKGFVLSAWLRLTDINHNAAVFDCVSTAGTNSDRLYMGVQYNSNYGWNYWYPEFAQGTTTRFSTQSSISAITGRWMHIMIAADQFGVLTAYMNGVASAVGSTASASYLPLRIARPQCRMGRSYTDSSLFKGDVAGFQMWDRALFSSEVSAIASAVPLAITGSALTIIGIPTVSVSPFLVPQVTVSIGLCTALAVHLTVYATADMATPANLPVDISWSGTDCNPKAFTLTLPTLAVGAISWPITFVLSGPGAALYQTPAPMVVYLSTYARTLSTAAFTLDTRSASTHAKWSAGYLTSGVAVFDGTTNGNFLDLNMPLDTGAGAQVMPMFGGTTKAQQGFSFSLWILFSSSRSAAIFDCSGSTGSDRIYFSYTTSYTQFYISLISTSSLNDNIGGALVLNQWTHLALSMDVWGLLNFYIGGVLVYSTSYNINYLPLMTARPQCRLGSDYLGSTGSALIGQVSGFTFWPRALLASEATSLSSSPPDGILNAPFTVLGIPLLVDSPTTVPVVTISTTVCTGAPVYLTVSTTTSPASTPALVSWFGYGGCGTKSVALLFPTLALNQTFWPVTFQLSGPGASFYQTPAATTVLAAVYSQTIATASLLISTAAPSAHAGWASGPPGTNSGFAVLGAGNYLDLTSTLDTGSIAMPSFGGSTTIPLGFSYGIWMQFTSSLFSPMPIFDCADAIGSTNNRITLSLSVSYYWFTVSWNYAAGTAAYTQSTGFTVLQLNQWFHFMFTVDNFGTAAAYFNGQKNAMASAATSALPQLSTRTKCAIGQLIDGTSYMPGSVAAFGFWTRSLLSTEVTKLAANPPVAVQQAQIMVAHMPVVASSPSTVAGIIVWPTLCSGPVITLTPVISSGGYSIPSSISWSAYNCAPVTITLNLPTLASNESGWTVQWALSGDAAAFFQTQPIAFIARQTPAYTAASAIFTLSTATAVPSGHAGWSLGNVAGTGYATFNGAQYLDITQSLDAGGPVMPTWGSVGGAKATGFAFATWVQFSRLGGTQQTLFDCGALAGSNTDRLYFTLITTYSYFALSYSIGATNIKVNNNAAGSLIPSANQWIHVALTVDDYGVATFYYNGAAFTSLGTETRLPTFTPRSVCRLGMDVTGANFMVGAMASFQFWNRGLLPVEVNQMANSAPAAFRPSQVGFVQLPAAAQPGATLPAFQISLPLVPAQLTITMNVIGNLGSTSPSSITWGGITVAAQSVQMVFPTTGTQTGQDWTLVFTISGDGAAAYASPPAVTIRQVSIDALSQSARFALNTTVPSQHAGWSAGLHAGSGMANFNYLSPSQGQYLDLQNYYDSPCAGGPINVYVGGTVMPLIWPSGTQGFSFSAWVYWAVTTPTGQTNARIVECSAALGTVDDQFYFGFSALGKAEVAWRLGPATSVQVSLTSTIAVSMMQWTHVSVTVTYGTSTVAIFLNGVAAGSSTFTSTLFPRTITRSACSTARTYNAVAGGNFVGSVSQLNYFDRALIAAETQMLASWIPDSLGPFTFSFTGMPLFTFANATWNSVGITPSACFTTMTLTMTVLPAGSVTPPTLSWTGSCATQFVTIMTGVATPSPTSWSIAFALGGLNAQSYIVPTASFGLITPESVSTSAAFTLLTASPSANAGWTAGAASNTGLVKLDGALQYIDLEEARDTGGQIFPTIPVSTGSPFAISMWINFQSGIVGTAPTLFECSASGSGVIRLSLTNATSGVVALQTVVSGTTTCSATFSADPFLLQQWVQFSFSYQLVTSAATRLIGYAHGRVVVDTPCEVPPMVTRSNCLIGNSYAGTTAWTGRVAGFQYFSRSLASAEMQALTTLVPTSVKGRITVQGVPSFVAPSQVISGITLSIDLCTMTSLIVSPVLTVVAPYGNPSVNNVVPLASLTFGTGSTWAAGCAPRTFSITLPVDTADLWTLELKLSGDAAAQFVTPTIIQMQSLTLAAVISTANFTLGFSESVQNAHFLPGLVTGTGSAQFSTATDFLALSYRADTILPVMPTTWGGDKSPWSFELLFQWNPSVTPSTAAVFFQCALNSASAWDAVSLVQMGTSNQVQFALNKNAVVAFAGPAWTLSASGAPQHIALTQDWFGVVRFYVNGAAVGSPFTAPWPNNAARGSCTIGRAAYGADSGHFIGSVHAARFYQSLLTDAAVALLANIQNFPVSIAPAQMLLAARPINLTAGETFDIPLRPSIYWGAALTVTVSTTSGAVSSSSVAFPANPTTGITAQTIRYTASAVPSSDVLTFTSSDTTHFVSPVQVPITVNAGRIMWSAPVAVLSGQVGTVNITSNVAVGHSVTITITSPQAPNTIISPSTVTLGGGVTSASISVVASGSLDLYAGGAVQVIQAALGGANAAGYVGPADISIPVIPAGTVTSCAAPAVTPILYGATVTFCFVLNAAPYSSGSVEVDLSVTGGLLSKYALTFTTTTWSLRQYITWTLPSQAGPVTLTTSLSGPNAFQYILGFPATQQLDVLAAIKVTGVPSSVLVGTDSTGWGASLLGWYASSAYMCATVNATNGAVTTTGSTSNSLCFTSGDATFSFLPGTVAGRAIIDITPSSGGDDTLFAPTTVTVPVLGYLQMIGSTSGGSGVQMLPGATVALRVIAVGLSADQLDLTLQTSTTALGSFSDTYFSFSPLVNGAVNSSVYVAANGQSYFDLTYTDASAATSTATYSLTVTVTGGNSASIFKSTATFTVAVAPAPTSSGGTSGGGTSGGGSSSGGTSGGSSSGGGTSGGTSGGNSGSGTSSGNAGSGTSSGGASGDGSGSGSGGGTTDGSGGSTPTSPCGYAPCPLGTPTAVLLSPSEVTDCGVAQLDGSSSFNIGPRISGGSFFFSLIHANLNGSDLLNATQSAHINTTEMVGITNILGDGGLGTFSSVPSDGSLLVIPGSQMQIGVEYVFQLIVKNYLYTSLPTTVSVMKVATPAEEWRAAQVVIQPPSLVQRASGRNDFTAQLLESTCAPIPSDAVLEYAWDVYSPVSNSLLESGDQPIFHLQPNSLTVGQTYPLQLTLSITSATYVTVLALVASYPVFVSPSPLVATIVGSDRQRSVSQSTTLDGSASFDPDWTGSGTGLAYLWSCRTGSAACTNYPSLAATALVKPTLTLAAYALQTDHSYTFTLTVRSLTAGDSRVATTNVTVTSTTAPTKTVPLVSIVNAPSGPINAATPLSLQAIYVAPRGITTALADLSVAWSVTPAGALADVDYLSSELSVPANLLEAGEIYTFRVAVIDPTTGASAMASTTVSVASPPTGGSCVATEASVMAGIEPVNIICSDWYSPISTAREPLRYSAAAIVLQTIDGVESPSDIPTLLQSTDGGSTNPSLFLYLPSQTIAVRVTVIDALGVAIDMDVAVSSTEPDEELDGLSCYADTTSTTSLPVLVNQQSTAGALTLVAHLAQLLVQSVQTMDDTGEDVGSCAPTDGSALTLDQLRVGTRRRLANAVLQAGRQTLGSIRGTRLTLDALSDIAADADGWSQLLAADATIQPALLSLVEDMIAALPVGLTAQFGASATDASEEDRTLLSAASATAAPISSSALVNSIANGLSALLTDCDQLDRVTTAITAVMMKQSNSTGATALSVNTAAYSDDAAISATLHRSMQGAPTAARIIASAAAGQTIAARGAGAPGSSSRKDTSSGASVTIDESSQSLLLGLASSSEVVSTVDTSAGVSRYTTLDTMMISTSGRWSNCRAAAPPTGASASDVASPLLGLAILSSSRANVGSATRTDKSLASRRLLATAATATVNVAVPMDATTLIKATVLKTAPAKCYLSAAAQAVTPLQCAVWSSATASWSTSQCTTGTPSADLTVPCSCRVSTGGDADDESVSVIFNTPDLDSSCFDLAALTAAIISKAGGDPLQVNLGTVLTSPVLATYVAESGTDIVSMYPSTMTTFVHAHIVSSALPGTLLPKNQFVDVDLLIFPASQYVRLAPATPLAFTWIYILANPMHLNYTVVGPDGQSLNGQVRQTALTPVTWNVPSTSTGATCSATAAADGWICTDGVLPTPGMEATASVAGSSTTAHSGITTDTVPGPTLGASDYVDLTVRPDPDRQFAQLSPVTSAKSFTWIYIVSNTGSKPYILVPPAGQLINGVAGNYVALAESKGTTCMANTDATGWTCIPGVAGVASGGTATYPSDNPTPSSVSLKNDQPTSVPADSYVNLDFGSNATGTFVVQLPSSCDGSYVWLYAPSNMSANATWVVEPIDGDTVNSGSIFTPATGSTGATCTANSDCKGWACVDGATALPVQGGGGSGVGGTVSVGSSSSKDWPYLFLACLYFGMACTSILAEYRWQRFASVFSPTNCFYRDLTMLSLAVLAAYRVAGCIWLYMQQFAPWFDSLLPLGVSIAMPHLLTFWVASLFALTLLRGAERLAATYAEQKLLTETAVRDSKGHQSDEDASDSSDSDSENLVVGPAEIGAVLDKRDAMAKYQHVPPSSSTMDLRVWHKSRRHRSDERAYTLQLSQIVVQLLFSAVVLILCLALLTTSNTDEQYNYYTAVVVITGICCIVFCGIWHAVHYRAMIALDPHMVEVSKSDHVPTAGRLGWLTPGKDAPALAEHQQRVVTVVMLHAHAYQRIRISLLCFVCVWFGLSVVFLLSVAQTDSNPSRTNAVWYATDIGLNYLYFALELIALVLIICTLTVATLGRHEDESDELKAKSAGVAAATTKPMIARKKSLRTPSGSPLMGGAPFAATAVRQATPPLVSQSRRTASMSHIPLLGSGAEATDFGAVAVAAMAPLGTVAAHYTTDEFESGEGTSKSGHSPRSRFSMLRRNTAGSVLPSPSIKPAVPLNRESSLSSLLQDANTDSDPLIDEVVALVPVEEPASLPGMADLEEELPPETKTSNVEDILIPNETDEEGTAMLSSEAPAEVTPDVAAEKADPPSPPSEAAVEAVVEPVPVPAVALSRPTHDWQLFESYGTQLSVGQFADVHLTNSRSEHTWSLCEVIDETPTELHVRETAAGEDGMRASEWIGKADVKVQPARSVSVGESMTEEQAPKPAGKRISQQRYQELGLTTVFIKPKPKPALPRWMQPRPSVSAVSATAASTAAAAAIAAVAQQRSMPMPAVTSSPPAEPARSPMPRVMKPSSPNLVSPITSPLDSPPVHLPRAPSMDLTVKEEADRIPSAIRSPSRRIGRRSNPSLGSPSTFLLASPSGVMSSPPPIPTNPPASNGTSSSSSPSHTHNRLGSFSIGPSASSSASASISTAHRTEMTQKAVHKFLKRHEALTFAERVAANNKTPKAFGSSAKKLG